MKRTHKLALAGAATLLSSVAVFTGVSSSYAAPANKARPARVAQVCVPAVPNPSDYTNCRLVRVQGDTTCRCRIVPQEQRQVQTPLDRGNLVTGAVLGLGAFGLINTDRPGDHGGTREGFASNNAPGGTSPGTPGGGSNAGGGSGTGNSGGGGHSDNAPGKGNSGGGGSKGGSSGSGGSGGSNPGGGTNPGGTSPGRWDLSRRRNLSRRRDQPRGRDQSW